MNNTNEKLTKITLRSKDPLAPLELADSTGMPIKVGRGILSAESLPPGFYRLRFRSPEGQVIEKPLWLNAGDKKDISIDSPPLLDTPLTQAMIWNSGAWKLPNAKPLDLLRNVMLESPASGEAGRGSGFSPFLRSVRGYYNVRGYCNNIADLGLIRPSTLLALAGSAANEALPQADFDLFPLVVSPFKSLVSSNIMSGIQLLFAVDSVSPALRDCYLSQVEIRLWPFLGPSAQEYARPQRLAFLRELGEAGIGVTTPGTYWLMLSLPGKESVVLPIALLPDRVTMLVIYHDISDYIHIFQYMPSLKTGKAQFERVRQLELFQRLYNHRYFEHAFQYLNLALGGHWNDPITGCLAGYLLLEQEDLGKGERQSMDFFFQNIVYRYINEISDFHIIMAEHAIRQGDDEVAQIALARALDVGLPIFADGMTRLLAGLHRYQIDHPLAAATAAVELTSRVQGLLWNAFTPGIPGNLEKAIQGW